MASCTWRGRREPSSLRASVSSAPFRPTTPPHHTPCTIPVIIDNFAQQQQTEELPVSARHVRQFVEVGWRWAAVQTVMHSSVPYPSPGTRSLTGPACPFFCHTPMPQVWAELDPHATNYMPATQLGSLLWALDPPLGLAGEDGGRAKLQNVVMALDVPVHGARVRIRSRASGGWSPWRGRPCCGALGRVLGRGGAKCMPVASQQQKSTAHTRPLIAQRRRGDDVPRPAMPLPLSV